jgi:hypothetical protein
LLKSSPPRWVSPAVAKTAQDLLVDSETVGHGGGCRLVDSDDKEHQVGDLRGCDCSGGNLMLSLSIVEVGWNGLFVEIALSSFSGFMKLNFKGSSSSSLSLFFKFLVVVIMVEEGLGSLFSLWASASLWDSSDFFCQREEASSEHAVSVIQLQLFRNWGSVFLFFVLDRSRQRACRFGLPRSFGFGVPLGAHLSIQCNTEGDNGSSLQFQLSSLSQDYASGAKGGLV